MAGLAGFVGFDLSRQGPAVERLATVLATLDDLGRDLDVAASLAQLAGHDGSARMLLAELSEELDLTRRLVQTRADLALAYRLREPEWIDLLLDRQSSLLDGLDASLGDQRGVAGTPADVRAYYQQRAFEAAGIDLDDWDVAAGVDGNRATIEAVYAYYARLYLDHPGMLWAGMAALMGPSFYGGFQDLDTFADLAGGAERLLQAASLFPTTLLPAGLESSLEQLAALSADDLEQEFRFFEQTFLSMQREIFLDQGTAHEAYLDGGMFAIEALFADDPWGYGPQTIEAWQQIDTGLATGDADLIAEGNRTLLLREQRRVIDDDYARMYSRPVTGPAVTYLATLAGAPSVPGAHTYPEVFPLDATVSASVATPDQIPIAVKPELDWPWQWDTYDLDVPQVEIGGSVTLATPLPDGNLARFEDRWALIETDTLPAYLDLAENDPGRIEEILAVPVGERAEAHTIDERIDDVVIWLATGWEVDVELHLDVDG